jgi:Fe2+ transport system protein FeoA
MDGVFLDYIENDNHYQYHFDGGIMTVIDAAPGALFKVLKVCLPGEIGKRLADMGFTAGAEGTVIRMGFLHGPIQVRIRGYDILIRRREAAGIEVELRGGKAA